MRMHTWLFDHHLSRLSMVNLNLMVSKGIVAIYKQIELLNFNRIVEIDTLIYMYTNKLRVCAVLAFMKYEVVFASFELWLYSYSKFKINTMSPNTITCRTTCNLIKGLINSKNFLILWDIPGSEVTWGEASTSLPQM